MRSNKYGEIFGIGFGLYAAYELVKAGGEALITGGKFMMNFPQDPLADPQLNLFLQEKLLPMLSCVLKPEDYQHLMAQATQQLPEMMTFYHHYQPCLPWAAGVVVGAAVFLHWLIYILPLLVAAFSLTSPENGEDVLLGLAVASALALLVYWPGLLLVGLLLSTIGYGIYLFADDPQQS